MKATRLYLLLYVLSTTGVLVNTFDPITTTVVIGVGATLGRTIYNYLHESCDQKWITFNATGKRVQLFLMHRKRQIPIIIGSNLLDV